MYCINIFLLPFFMMTIIVVNINCLLVCNNNVNLASLIDVRYERFSQLNNVLFIILLQCNRNV